MRQKKAKAIRRLAQKASVGKEERNYVKDKKTGVISLGDCTRQIYQHLKRRQPWLKR